MYLLFFSVCNVRLHIRMKHVGTDISVRPAAVDCVSLICPVGTVPEGIIKMTLKRVRKAGRRPAVPSAYTLVC